MKTIEENYQLWLANAAFDPDLIAELKEMDEVKKEDAFYRDLEFGTGGLRGVIGAGTNRMNVYTVGKASQGLAQYIINHYPEGERRIAISYDSRNKSEMFAHFAATVFAGNGIRVFIYPTLMPVPMCSYATRELRCSAGVMVTASHNPAKYNGYKVYGNDGCQITTEAADEVLSLIGAVDVFKDIKRIEFGKGLEEGVISFIPDSIYDSFIEQVKNQSLLGDEKIDKNVAIVYTPLNGAGLRPVTRALKEMGYTNISVVKEQEMPDGNFPTCPFPNPEIQEAMALGMKLAKEQNADLLIATDPDCDRVGIAVKDDKGEYQLITGNQTGCLLFNYICERRTALGTMPEDPIMVKTIVTTDLAKKIADHYNVKTIDVLTGFKFIGDQIAKYEKMGKASSYIFGFEESYGCLTGTYVRDKDAVNGATLIAEMFAYYKSKGVSLLTKLQELYDAYGYTLNTLHSYYFEGSSGFAKMQKLMNTMRVNGLEFKGLKLERSIDYLPGYDGLPSSNVLQYYFDKCSAVIRPSGTEPKIKIYFTISAPSKEEAEILEKDLAAQFEKLL